MTNSWMNEDGEPIMSGEAWRFEQALDAEYAEQRADWDMDDFRDPEPRDPEYCDHPDTSANYKGVQVCDWCETEVVFDEPDQMEDQWLDGSWEE